MKTMFPKLLSLAALGTVAVVAAPPVAPVVNGTVGAAANVTAPVVRPVLPPPPAVSATANSTVTGNVNGTVNGAAGTVGTAGSAGISTVPAINPGSAATSAGAYETIGMRQERLRLQTEAAGNTSVAAPALTATSQSSAAVVLDATPTLNRVRHTTYATRSQVSNELEARVDASAAALARANASAVALDAQAKASYEIAADNARTREKVLRASLAAARKAEEKTWDSARTRVAMDFELYAVAASEAEARAQVAKP